MSDVKVMRIEEMESAANGVMVRARASLGVRSFGMQVLNLPPNHPDYPEHDETSSGQEEIYIPLRGSAKLTAGGKSYDLVPGVFARVGPAEKRKLHPGQEGLQVLVLGGVPGKVFAPSSWTELESKG